MLEPQIAVPVPDATVADAGGEALALGFELAKLESADIVEGWSVDDLPDERLDLREVLVDVGAQGGRLAEGRRRPRRAKEGRQPLRQGGQRRRRQRVPRQQ